MRYLSRHMLIVAGLCSVIAIGAHVIAAIVGTPTFQGIAWGLTFMPIWQIAGGIVHSIAADLDAMIPRTGDVSVVPGMEDMR